jgi:hypothetical protein
MKIKNAIPLAAAVAFFTALSVPAYYDPSIGRWASRDPVNALTDGRARFDLFKADGLDDPSAASMANQASTQCDYAFVNNSAIVDWDFLGLTCTTLTASGTFTYVNELFHKVPYYLFGINVPGNRLTFSACCPCGKPSNFRLWSGTQINSPSDELFPSKWAQDPGTYSGSCVTVTFEVPWRATPPNNTAAALNGILMNYDCCCPFCPMLWPGAH